MNYYTTLVRGGKQPQQSSPKYVALIRAAFLISQVVSCLKLLL